MSYLYTTIYDSQRVTDISYTEATVDWEERESESDSDIADTE